MAKTHRGIHLEIYSISTVLTLESREAHPSSCCQGRDYLVKKAMVSTNTVNPIQIKMIHCSEYEINPSVRMYSGIPDDARSGIGGAAADLMKMGRERRSHHLILLPPKFRNVVFNFIIPLIFKCFTFALTKLDIENTVGSE